MNFRKFITESLLKEDIWDYEPQEFDSADTSQHQNPSAITHLIRKLSSYLHEGNINADIGGGKYFMGTDLLKAVGIENLIYDPFNQTEAHNKAVVERIRDHQAPTVTVSNVLNVIKEPEVRAHVLRQALNAVADGGIIVISIYNADPKAEHEETKRGEGRMTRENKKSNKKSWQNNLPTEAYMDEVKTVLNGMTVTKHGQVIVAKK